MNHPESQTKRIFEKFQQLMKQYQMLQKENLKLKEDVLRMGEKYNGLAEESEKYRQRAEILKLSGNNMDEADRKSLEKRLNQYVKEIDRCIALLND